MAGDGIDRRPQHRHAQNDIQGRRRRGAQALRPWQEALGVDQRGALRQCHFLPTFGWIDLAHPGDARPAGPRDRLVHPADFARRADLVFAQLSLALQQVDRVDRRRPRLQFGNRSQVVVLAFPAALPRQPRQIADPPQPLGDGLGELFRQRPAIAAAGPFRERLAPLQGFDLALQSSGFAAHARHRIRLAQLKRLPQDSKVRLPQVPLADSSRTPRDLHRHHRLP